MRIFLCLIVPCIAAALLALSARRSLQRATYWLFGSVSACQRGLGRALLPAGRLKAFLSVHQGGWPSICGRARVNTWRWLRLRIRTTTLRTGAWLRSIFDASFKNCAVTACVRSIVTCLDTGMGRRQTLKDGLRSGFLSFRLAGRRIFTFFAHKSRIINGLRRRGIGSSGQKTNGTLGPGRGLNFCVAEGAEPFNTLENTRQKWSKKRCLPNILDVEGFGV